MKYREQRELVEDLRALADFYERPESLALPVPYNAVSHSYSIYEYSYDDEAGKSERDPEKELDRIRRIGRALGACEKEYAGDDLVVTKKFGNHCILRYRVSRDAVCEKKLVGVETIPAHFSPAHTREIYEYDCKPVSLLKG